MTTPTEGVGTPTPQLQKFYLTFGVQYSHTPHPTWPGAHPDGWVLIEAANEDRARGLAYLYFKANWSMLYPEAHFPVELNKQKYYPFGEIAALAVGHATVPLHHQLGRGFEAPAYAVQINGTSDPLYYGVLPTATIGARIMGRLLETDAEGEEYDVEYVHTECLGRGVALFDHGATVDDNVLAMELDWSLPYECPVCGVSLT